VQSLRLHPGVPDELDEEAVADFVLSGWSSNNARTTFTAIARVPPAHSLNWSAGYLAAPRRYWRLPDFLPLVRFPRPQDYPERFRELTDDAVRDRLPAGPVALQLTGGMDSTSVAASAKVALAGRGAADILAVTLSLGGPERDVEAALASSVASHLGLSHHIIDGSSQPVIDPWTAPRVVLPEPMPYQRTAQQLELGDVLARFARVAFTGVAGDCLVWSSPWYWAEWLAHGRVVRLLKALGHEISVPPRVPGIGLHAAARQLARGRHAPEVPNWLAPDFAARTGAAQRLARKWPARSKDARSLAQESLWPAWGMWGHPTFSGLPVKLRHPLLDLRLIEYALSLPPHPWLVDKRVMREANIGRLPEQVLLRPKTPLGSVAMPANEPAVLAQTAAFVREVPGLERFVLPEVLASALISLGEAEGTSRELELSRPLGLAHWLWHGWRRPSRLSQE